MDIQVKEMNNKTGENNVKITIKDFFIGLRDVIVGGNKTSKNEKEIDDRLEKIYKVEKELGATESIGNLEREATQHEIEKQSKIKKKNSNEVVINKIISEKEISQIESEHEIDR